MGEDSCPWLFTLVLTFVFPGTISWPLADSEFCYHWCSQEYGLTFGPHTGAMDSKNASRHVLYRSYTRQIRRLRRHPARLGKHTGLKQWWRRITRLRGAKFARVFGGIHVCAGDETPNSDVNRLQLQLNSVIHSGRGSPKFVRLWAVTANFCGNLTFNDTKDIDKFALDLIPKANRP